MVHEAKKNPMLRSCAYGSKPLNIIGENEETKIKTERTMLNFLFLFFLKSVIGLFGCSIGANDNIIIKDVTQKIVLKKFETLVLFAKKLNPQKIKYVPNVRRKHEK